MSEEDHVTVAQWETLVAGQQKQGDMLEELAKEWLGPRRTVLQGGGRIRELGAIHRLEKVEADALEAVTYARTAQERQKLDLKDRSTRIAVAVISAIALVLSTVGGAVAAALLGNS